jgi:hypothetical protein
MILDPFCGCGTTIDAAEKLDRQWIGIDVTQLAISLIKNRLLDTYGRRLKFISGPVGTTSTSSQTSHHIPAGSLVRIIGEPTTPNEAATLAEEDKYQLRSASSARAPSSKRKARITALTAKSFSATTSPWPNRNKSSCKSRAARPA